ncbi:MAG: glycosyltransferase [Gemmatimonadetes bacterium]|nr:MAG: glycosyltransferase [Gemmatimonadota bacterium]
MTARASLRIVAHNGARIFGGAERWTARTLAGLSARGHRATLLCRDERIASEARRFGIDTAVGRVGGQLMVPDAFRLARRLRKLAPDVVLITTFKKVWLVAMAARLAGVPRVVARIGRATDLPGRSRAYRWALQRWTDLIVVNADALRAPVLDDLPAVGEDRVRVIYNGVRIPRGEPDRAGARGVLGVPGEALVVGAVSRLVREKRLDWLIDVAAREPRAHVVLIGDGPDLERLRDAAAARGVAGRVHFAGHREDAATVVAALDLYAVASRVEGMSNAMLEAMAVGVPVVSTDVSGAREALLPGSASGCTAARDGWAEAAAGVVVPHERDAFVSASLALLRDAPARAACARAARKRAEACFSLEAALDAWERALHG